VSIKNQTKRESNKSRKEYKNKNKELQQGEVIDKGCRGKCQWMGDEGVPAVKEVKELGSEKSFRSFKR
jgi:hypothetical protein